MAATTTTEFAPAFPPSSISVAPTPGEEKRTSPIQKGISVTEADITALHYIGMPCECDLRTFYIWDAPKVLAEIECDVVQIAQRFIPLQYSAIVPVWYGSPNPQGQEDPSAFYWDRIATSRLYRYMVAWFMSFVDKQFPDISESDRTFAFHRVFQSTAMHLAPTDSLRQECLYWYARRFGKTTPPLIVLTRIARPSSGGTFDPSIPILYNPQLQNWWNQLTQMVSGSSSGSGERGETKGAPAAARYEFAIQSYVRRVVQHVSGLSNQQSFFRWSLFFSSLLHYNRTPISPGMPLSVGQRTPNITMNPKEWAFLGEAQYGMAKQAAEQPSWNRAPSDGRRFAIWGSRCGPDEVKQKEEMYADLRREWNSAFALPGDPDYDEKKEQFAYQFDLIATNEYLERPAGVPWDLERLPEDANSKQWIHDWLKYLSAMGYVARRICVESRNTQSLSWYAHVDSFFGPTGRKTSVYRCATLRDGMEIAWYRDPAYLQILLPRSGIDIVDFDPFVLALQTRQPSVLYNLVKGILAAWLDCIILVTRIDINNPDIPPLREDEDNTKTAPSSRDFPHLTRDDLTRIWHCIRHVLEFCALTLGFPYDRDDDRRFFTDSLLRVCTYVIRSPTFSHIYQSVRTPARFNIASWNYDRLVDGQPESDVSPWLDPLQNQQASQFVGVGCVISPNCEGVRRELTPKSITDLCWSLIILYRSSNKLHDVGFPSIFAAESCVLPVVMALDMETAMRPISDWFAPDLAELETTYSEEAPALESTRRQYGVMSRLRPPAKLTEEDARFLAIENYVGMDEEFRLPFDRAREHAGYHYDWPRLATVYLGTLLAGLEKAKTDRYVTRRLFAWHLMFLFRDTKASHYQNLIRAYNDIENAVIREYARTIGERARSGAARIPSSISNQCLVETVGRLTTVFGYQWRRGQSAMWLQQSSTWSKELAAQPGRPGPVVLAPELAPILAPVPAPGPVPVATAAPAPQPAPPPPSTSSSSLPSQPRVPPRLPPPLRPLPTPSSSATATPSVARSVPPSATGPTVSTIRVVPLASPQTGRIEQQQWITFPDMDNLFALLGRASPDVDAAALTRETSRFLQTQPSSKSPPTIADQFRFLATSTDLPFRRHRIGILVLLDDPLSNLVGVWRFANPDADKLLVLRYSRLSRLQSVGTWNVSLFRGSPFVDASALLYPAPLVISGSS